MSQSCQLRYRYINRANGSIDISISQLTGFGWLCWGLTSQSTIFQSCRDGAIASWVINQYFRGVKCLAQGHNTAAVGLEPRTSRSGVRHSTTEPPRSPIDRIVLALLIYLYLNWQDCLGSIDISISQLTELSWLYWYIYISADRIVLALLIYLYVSWQDCLGSIDISICLLTGLSWLYWYIYMSVDRVVLALLIYLYVCWQDCLGSIDISVSQLTGLSWLYWYICISVDRLVFAL